MYWPEDVEWLRIHQAAGVLVRSISFPTFCVSCTVGNAQTFRLEKWIFRKQLSMGTKRRNVLTISMVSNYFSHRHMLILILILRVPVTDFKNENLEMHLTCPMPLSLRLDWTKEFPRNFLNALSTVAQLFISRITSEIKNEKDRRRKKKHWIMYDCFIQNLFPSGILTAPPSKHLVLLYGSTEQHQVREDNPCSEKLTAQVGVDMQQCFWYWDHRFMAHFCFQPTWETQFHELKTQWQLSASYFEGALHGFLCFAPEPSAKLWSWSLFGCFRVMQKSEEINNHSGWWNLVGKYYSFLLCSWTIPGGGCILVSDFAAFPKLRQKDKTTLTKSWRM